MTREEALERLDRIPTIGEQVDALEMAIEALKGGDAEMNEVKSPYMQPSPNGADLISRADAIEAVEQEYKIDRGYMADDYTYGFNQAIQYVSNIILQDLPSAEAVQGEWIKTVDGNGWNEWWVFKCPICGAVIEDKQYRSWEYNFCPNCGADNRKGK